METTHKISWNALRYSETNDNKMLQIGINLLLGLMVVLSIVFKNYLFGAFILIASVMLFYTKNNETKYIAIDVGHSGISIEHTLIEYSSLLWFWINTNSSTNTSYLFLKFKGGLFGSVKVIVIEPEIDISELRIFLSQYLKEKEIKQSSTDKLINSF
ncbi:hypothetical protein L0P88_13885 [Muricauda sp. SCSIO 64092]|uniref:hypothetical protein n=1 Tax=Allomuricauda sp. SCSIO 64092 TaxID=2908842 RepID=UPI001FF5312A|nr:hypothetical protein [Muricauda sp. SCSIO 64092]UOY05043.1 hypothetical protein L0P88_13885 [Muricauda sp. SCSIO 64092]